MGWIVKQTNQYGSMNASEMQNNAVLFYNRMKDSFSNNAICGMLGNIQWESYINPGQWQGSYDVGDMNGGFGLVMWTPASKIFTALGESNAYDGDAQTDSIKNLVANEWLTTETYPMSWDEFKSSDLGVKYLADVFCYNYERAGSLHLTERETYAQEWFDYFSENPPDPGPGPEPVGKKKMSIIFYLKRRRRY